MRVLVIEDDRRLGDYMARGLRENGCTVDLSGDGVDGAYLAQSEAYDVVVLDIMLPGQSGFEVIRQVRRHGVKIPILCVTARDDLDDRVLGLDLGADDYLVKPFQFAELLARLAAWAWVSVSATALLNCIMGQLGCKARSARAVPSKFVSRLRNFFCFSFVPY